MQNQQESLDSRVLRADSKNSLNFSKYPYRLISEKYLKIHKSTQFFSKCWKNKSEQMRPNNCFYTTLNSSIRYIAQVVYEEIGEGQDKNQMSFSNFKFWISKNDGILKTFDKWLRTDIWSCSAQDHANCDGRHPNKIEGYMKVNMKKKQNRVKFYRKLFLSLTSNILKLYTSSKREELVNLYILKDVRISFEKWNMKIKIFHAKSPEFQNLTIVFDQRDKFQKWKAALKPFIFESVEKFYNFKEKIGRGTFSIVNLAERKNNLREQVAIKTIDKQVLMKPELDLIQQEANIIKELAHENIVKLLHHFEDFNKKYFVFELVEGVDLMEYVVSKQRLSEPVARRIFKELLKVVRYIHQRNILHRDIKAENIMVRLDPASGEVLGIKVIDFGFATFFSKDDLPCLPCGTINYAAPEVLLGEKYDESSALFSCGVLLYFMYFSEAQFNL